MNNAESVLPSDRMSGIHAFFLFPPFGSGWLLVKWIQGWVAEDRQHCLYAACNEIFQEQSLVDSLRTNASLEVRTELRCVYILKEKGRKEHFWSSVVRGSPG